MDSVGHAGTDHHEEVGVSPTEWCRSRPVQPDPDWTGHRANLRSSYTTRFDTMARLQSVLPDLAERMTGTDPR